MLSRMERRGKALVARRGKRTGEARPLDIAMFFDRGHPSGQEASIGALREAQKHANWDVRFISIHFHKDIGGYFPPAGKPPDGILCCGWIYDTIWDILSDRGLLGKIPMAVADYTENPECPLPGNAVAVTADDAAVGRVAAESFLSRRFLNFAYVGGYEHSGGEAFHSSARRDAFRNAAMSGGGRFCGAFRPENENFFGAEQDRLVSWLKSLHKPCALLAYNDGTAEKVARVCAKAGISIPEMVSMMGVDNDAHSCETCSPRLSSVELDREESGRMAAEQLAVLLGGATPPATRLVFGVRRIVERESSIDLRGGGRLVSEASRIITGQALSGITVSDIARKLNVSRSLLNLRFREILGTTVRETILRARFAEVERLLANTSMRCGEIAMACGWNDPAVLFHLFRRREGMSMREWRARNQRT